MYEEIYVKIYIFWKFIKYTIHWDKTQMLTKISFEQNKRYEKSTLFFFHELKFITILLLIRNSYTGWNTWFIPLRLGVRFTLLIPSRFHYSLSFCSTKSMDSSTLKRHNSRQNRTNRKAAHGFATGPLILKLQQEVWKFNDTCVS